RLVPLRPLDRRLAQSTAGRSIPAYPARRPCSIFLRDLAPATRRRRRGGVQIARHTTQFAGCLGGERACRRIVALPERRARFLQSLIRVFDGTPRLNECPGGHARPRVLQL